MSLDESKAPAPRTNFEPVDAGNHFARIIGMVDRGVQKQEYKGESKADAQEVDIIFELPFLPVTFEKDGEVVTKPRWISKTIRVFTGDQSTLTKIKAALGVNTLKELLGQICNITVVQKESRGNVYANVTGVAAPAFMPGYDISQFPAPATPYRVFDFDTPTKESWDALSAYQQGVIKQAVNFGDIAAAIGEQQAAPQSPAPLAPPPVAQAAPAAPVQQAPVQQANPATLQPAPQAVPQVAPQAAPVAQAPAAQAPVAPVAPVQQAAPQVAPQAAPQVAPKVWPGTAVTFDDDTPF